MATCVITFILLGIEAFLGSSYLIFLLDILLIAIKNILKVNAKALNFAYTNKNYHLKCRGYRKANTLAIEAIL